VPSGLNDTIVDAVLDKLAGAGADTSLLGATMYLDALTTEPSDDNGTGAVSWGQGRLAVTVADGTNWSAASGRAKTSGQFALPANTSGGPIDVVALAWYSAASGGTYKGGGPVPGGTLTIPAGVAPVVTATLASPSPS
jgi:hypothetical protein